MADIIRPVKGTRDFYPAEMTRRTWLYDHIRAVSERFGYTEYEAPILESLELYAAKSGEELVKEQAFVFEDRGGALVALRPELTPSLARMVAQREQQLTRPIRWWSFGPFWRYERPQRGRTREFFQWNIDILGADTILADAEIGSIAAAFFAAIGLSPEQVVIHVNNRVLMDEKIGALGVPADARPVVLNLIDRLDKMQADAWDERGRALGLSDEQLARLREMLAHRELWRESAGLTAFFETVEAMGWREWFAFEPSIVRGLDYYTGIVFEGRDRDGGRAIFGGGRYDSLVADVGGQGMPATGFAMGDVVLGLIAEKYGLAPAGDASPAHVLVTVFDAALAVESARLAAEIRAAGIPTELYPRADKLGRQFKYADRQRIPTAVVLGPDEQAAGTTAVKDLASGEQVSVARSGLIAHLAASFAAPPS